MMRGHFDAIQRQNTLFPLRYYPRVIYPFDAIP